MIKILVADDDRLIRQSIKITLMGESYEIVEVGDLNQVYPTLLAECPDLLLLDMHFKEGTSLSVLKTLAEEHLKIPTLILSGAASAREAAEAIQYGAYDYVEKPISAERLRLAISRCLEDAQVKRALQGLTTQTSRKAELIGVSPATAKIRSLIEQYGKKDIKVLITGETGVGKEVVAHALWQASGRSARPFIVVNSAAIPDNLIESELFGHKKGAFTGALTDQVGKIELADQGTLFLDEIGDLSMSAQTKLLRFLETGEIQKIGTHQSKISDVRLIFATSRDLEKELAKKHFRPDLFYRLNVVRIHIPPLRERLEDVPLLFSYFVQGFCRKFNEEEKIIDSEVYEVLQSYRWPGNVRELRNIAERVVVIAGQRIKKEHLQQLISSSPQDLEESADELPTLSFKEFKKQSERDYIQMILKKTKGSVTKAAKLLGMDRTYLHQKMSQLDIHKDSAEV